MQEKIHNILKRIPEMKLEIVDPCRHEKVFSFLSLFELPLDVVLECVELSLSHRDERVIALGLKLLGLAIHQHGIIDHEFVVLLFTIHPSDILNFASISAISLFITEHFETVKNSMEPLLDTIFENSNLFVTRAFVNLCFQIHKLDSEMISRRVVALVQRNPSHGILFVECVLGDLKSAIEMELLDSVFQCCFSNDRVLQSHALSIITTHSYSFTLQQVLSRLPNLTSSVTLAKALELLLLVGLKTQDVVGMIEYILFKKPLSISFDVDVGLLTLVSPFIDLLEKTLTLEFDYDQIQNIVMHVDLNDRKVVKAIVGLVKQMFSYETQTSTLSFSVLHKTRFEYISMNEYKDLISISCHLHLEKVIELILAGTLEEPVAVLSTLLHHTTTERVFQLGILQNEINSEDSSIRIQVVQVYQAMVLEQYSCWEWFDWTGLTSEVHTGVLEEILELIILLIKEFVTIVDKERWKTWTGHEDAAIRLLCLEMINLCNETILKDYEMMQLLQKYLDDDSIAVKRRTHELLRKLDPTFIKEWVEDDWEYRDVIEMSDSIMVEKDDLNEGNNVLFCYDC